MPKVSWNFNDETDERLFDSLCVVIRRRIPGFKIKYKNESIWQKILGFFLFFNKEYMTKYTTTFYPVVWFPSREFVEKKPWQAFKILAHEYIHLLDTQKRPFLFRFFYVSPQCFALLSVIAVAAIWFSNWWLMGLLPLICLAPWPSTGRAALEMRGYSMNITINMWRYGGLSEETRNWIVEKFAGWEYYKMMPNEKFIRKWIGKTEQLVRNIDAVKVSRMIFDESEAYSEIYEMLTGIDFNSDVED